MTNFQNKVINLFKKGYTHSQICKQLNCPKSSVSSVKSRFIDELGEVSKEYYNTSLGTYFDVIDSERKAYFLGFFLADGSVSSTGRFSINIPSTDRNILDELALELNLSTKVIIRERAARKVQAQLRWTNQQMFNTFKEVYNILPDKTHHPLLQNLLNKIPDEYKASFIRGFFDGDGCLEADKGVFTFRFVGTDFNFLEQISTYLCNRLPDTSYYFSKKEGKTCFWYVFTLNFHRIDKPTKVYTLYNLLYQNATIWLDRKRQKFISYLKYRGKL